MENDDGLALCAPQVFTGMPGRAFIPQGRVEGNNARVRVPREFDRVGVVTRNEEAVFGLADSANPSLGQRCEERRHGISERSASNSIDRHVPHLRSLSLTVQKFRPIIPHISHVFVRIPHRHRIGVEGMPGLFGDTLSSDPPALWLQPGDPTHPHPPIKNANLASYGY